jgi:hypothetical protein
VRPYDNHVIHLKVLNDFRKSIDYENLPIDMQAHVDAHAAIHESLVLRQMGIQVPTPSPTQDPVALTQAQMAAGGPASSPSSSATAPPPGPGGQSPGPPGQQTTTALPQTAQLAGIGGAGQQGQVPGIPIDTQAAATGQ